MLIQSIWSNISKLKRCLNYTIDRGTSSQQILRARALPCTLHPSLSLTSLTTSYLKSYCIVLLLWKVWIQNYLHYLKENWKILHYIFDARALILFFGVKEQCFIFMYSFIPSKRSISGGIVLIVLRQKAIISIMAGKKLVWRSLFKIDYTRSLSKGTQICLSLWNYFYSEFWELRFRFFTS